jgi:hypothetical protein
MAYITFRSPPIGDLLSCALPLVDPVWVINLPRLGTCTRKSLFGQLISPQNSKACSLHVPMANQGISQPITQTHARSIMALLPDGLLLMINDGPFMTQNLK